MLKELFDALVAHAGKLKAATPVPTNNPRVLTYLIDGEWRHVDVGPGVFRHVVHSLEALAMALAARSDSASHPIIFHSMNEVLAFPDVNDMRDSIRLPLIFSELWKEVTNLGHAPISQEDFVRLIKMRLRNCVPATLRDHVSKIEVTTSIGVKSELSPGREKGSREFASEGSKDIPEQFSCNIPVYANPGLTDTFPMLMAMDVSLRSNPVTFTVRPSPDEIAKGIQFLQGFLSERLRKLCPEATIVYGSPTDAK
jgi:hypothetical protein